VDIWITLRSHIFEYNYDHDGYLNIATPTVNIYSCIHGHSGYLTKTTGTVEYINIATVTVDL
jgi:hypothetical protein